MRLLNSGADQGCESPAKDGSEREGNFERKFKDPDGVVFDISHHGWIGTDSYKKKS